MSESEVGPLSPQRDDERRTLFRATMGQEGVKLIEGNPSLDIVEFEEKMTARIPKPDEPVAKIRGVNEPISTPTLGQEKVQVARTNVQPLAKEPANFWETLDVWLKNMLSGFKRGGLG